MPYPQRAWPTLVQDCAEAEKRDGGRNGEDSGPRLRASVSREVRQLPGAQRRGAAPAAKASLRGSFLPRPPLLSLWEQLVLSPLGAFGIPNGKFSFFSFLIFILYWSIVG